MTDNKKPHVPQLIQSKILPSELSRMTSIQEVHEYYQKIISCMPNNVYWLDRNCITQGCNNNVLNFIGLNKLDEFIGLNYQQMGEIAGWKDGHAGMYQRDDMEVMATGKSKLNIEDPPIYDEQGNAVFYLTSRVPVFNDEQQVIGVVGISVDITQRKKMEDELRLSRDAAESANEAKTEFLSNMRHDIRTPLSGIVGFSELLKSESTETHIKEYADNLIASSHALLHLMDEVLEAVRVSSGEIPLLKRKFHLAKLFEQIIDLCKARAHEKQLKLNLELDSKLPRFAIGDKIRLHRIALELISNALNFTDEGHVTLKVELARQENGKLIIKITITDSGMGIPQEKQQDIYVQFKRLTPSYQGIYKGAGLGLFVVKQFIDELNGEIYVESEPHKGTCFTCVIPLQESLLDDASGINETTELKLDKPYMAPLTHEVQSTIETTLNETTTLTKVLVVEDNIIARLAVKIIMSSMACQVDLASTGEEAILSCQTNHYDLILMDIGLGDGMDGYDVTRHIRNLHEDMKHIPIIALTAHAGDENKQRCIEAGMNAVLTKPLTKVQAEDILKTFVPARKPPPVPIVRPARRDLPDTDLEMFQIEQFSLFDEEQGIKNSGSKTMLIELLAMMASDIPSDLEKIKTAFENKDIAQVEHLAHKIKGGAVYVGTTRLKYACQYLERYWKSGERKLFNDLYYQAIKTMAETENCINEWLHENDKPA